MRAAAVTALAKFGAQCVDLRPSIEVLLRRCILDNDDEVRDRATFYLHVLKSGDAVIINNFILDGLQVSPSGLETCLKNYLDAGDFTNRFDIKIVPVTSQLISQPERRIPAMADPVEAPKASKKDTAAGQFVESFSNENYFLEVLSTIPQFAALGPLFRSSEPVPLTDNVTEFPVTATKHVFANHLVVQV